MKINGKSKEKKIDRKTILFVFDEFILYLTVFSLDLDSSFLQISSRKNFVKKIFI